MSKRLFASFVSWIVVATVLGLLTGGCGEGIRVSDDDASPIKTYHTLRSTLDSKDNGLVVLVDPRPAKYYDKAHAEGAINIPCNEMMAGDSRMSNAKTIIIIAGGWNDLLGIAGAKKLMALGYANVWYFPGGLEQWKSEGGPVIVAATTQPATEPAK